MADEPQQPQSSASSGKKKGAGGRGMQIAILALLMLGEGVGVFFVSRAMNSAPSSAEAADAGEDSADADMLVEIELAECNPSNKMTGKIINFRLRVIGLVAKEDAERAAKLVHDNQARILDRVNYVIRSAEPSHLNEPELATLERRLKQEFDRMFGAEELIRQVLIPELQQSGSGL